MPAQAENPKPTRRWFQFRLSSLVLFVTVVCLGLGVFAYRRDSAQRRVAAIKALEELGHLERDRRALPPDSRVVVGVTLSRRFPHRRDFNDIRHRPWEKKEPSAVTDATLVHLAYFRQIERLDLTGSRVTDAGLLKLTRLKRMRELVLDGSPITDVGLARLRMFPKLEVLSLDSTRISDAGLVHLASLPNLTHLNLSATEITDEGLAHLTKLPKLRCLRLDSTKVRGPGLAHLASHPSLTDVSFELLPISDEDHNLAHFSVLTNIKHLTLNRTFINSDGADQLMKLTNLESLTLRVHDPDDLWMLRPWMIRSPIARADADTLREALPKTKIRIN